MADLCAKPPQLTVVFLFTGSRKLTSSMLSIRRKFETESTYYVFTFNYAGTRPGLVPAPVTRLLTGEKGAPLNLSRHGLAGARSRTYTSCYSASPKGLLTFHSPIALCMG